MFLFFLDVQHRSMNAIEEALAFKRYVEILGWGGMSELAQQIGKSQEFVTKRIQLLRLPEKIQQEIIRQRITPSAALEMLPMEKQVIEELAESLTDNRLTEDEIRNIGHCFQYIEYYFNLSRLRKLTKRIDGFSPYLDSESPND